MFTPALTELTSGDIEEEGVLPAAGSSASHSAKSLSIIITSPQYNSLPDLSHLPLPSLSITNNATSPPPYTNSLPDLPYLPHLPYLPDLPPLRPLPSLSGSINNGSPHYTVTNSLPNLPPLPLQIEDSAGTRGQSI